MWINFLFTTPANPFVQGRFVIRHSAWSSSDCDKFEALSELHSAAKFSLKLFTPLILRFFTLLEDVFDTVDLLTCCLIGVNVGIPLRTTLVFGCAKVAVASFG